MSGRPTVPPLKRRGTDVLIPPAGDREPVDKPPKNAKVMVYMPPELLDELDDLLIDARRVHGRAINRSKAVVTALRMVIRNYADTYMDELGEEE